MTPEQIEVEGMRLSAPYHRCTVCGQNTYPTSGIVPDRCVACERTLLKPNERPMLQFDNRPLLAQCAALLDSLLGGPVVGSGIIDEIRRVRAELAKEGW